MLLLSQETVRPFNFSSSEYLRRSSIAGFLRYVRTNVGAGRRYYAWLNIACIVSNREDSTIFVPGVASIAQVHPYLANGTRRRS